MNRPTIGVVGPRDLVGPIASVAEDTGRCPVRRIPYRSEREAVRLVRGHHDEVDAWLFTGIVPHRLADAAEAIAHPAEHVSYSGVTLLSVVVRLLRDGYAVDALSVDTLDPNEVQETLRAAGLDATRVEVLPHAAGQRGEEVAAFHREAGERLGADAVALTCLGSAYTALRRERHAVRVVPANRDVRDAVLSLLLKTQSHRHADAQVAVGIAELPGAKSPRTALTPLLGELGASAFELDDGTLAFVTTRGPLSAVTRDFTGLPILAELADANTGCHLGLGIGRSAAEAEALARTAAGRARQAGPVAAALARRGEAPYVLQADDSGAAGVATPDLQQLASRAGISKQTLLDVRAMLGSSDDDGFTAQDVAQEFGLHERSARRLVKQLERAGLAVASGRRINGPGRPIVVYQLRL